MNMLNESTPACPWKVCDRFPRYWYQSPAASKSSTRKCNGKIWQMTCSSWVICNLIKWEFQAYSNMLILCLIHFRLLVRMFDIKIKVSYTLSVGHFKFISWFHRPTQFQIGLLNNKYMYVSLQKHFHFWFVPKLNLCICLKTIVVKT